MDETIFKMVKCRYTILDKKMESYGFNFNYVSKLTIKYTKINTKKGLSYKSATINPKNIDDRCFWYVFAPTQHYIEIKSHPE